VADFIGETNFVNGKVLTIDGRQAEFEADGLKMVANVEPGVTAGARATLAVRPERIILSQEPPADTPNAYQAEVYEMIYVGNDTRFRVRLAPTVSLSVRRQNSLPIGMPALQGPVGMRTWVSWHPDSARVLPD
jgi:ABC-type Fe3+/spermidine/putrescine transport system ATPase subunit